MGGTSSQNQQQQQTQRNDPWGPAGGVMQGVLGKLGGINPDLTGAETGALNSLYGLGAAGNQFTGGLDEMARRIFSGSGDQNKMVSDAYSKYQAALDPFASGQYVDPSQNPALQKYLQVARDDASNSINAQFAGAGRDLSGMNSQALGRGIGQAEAPILMDAYNRARGDQLSAINNLFGAGGQTAGLLSGLNAANAQAGAGAAGAATSAREYGPMMQLQAEAQRRGIPLQTMAQMMGISLPAGQAFGTQTGSGSASGQKQMSDAERFKMLMSGSKDLFSLFGSGGGIFG